MIYKSYRIFVLYRTSIWLNGLGVRHYSYPYEVLKVSMSTDLQPPLKEVYSHLSILNLGAGDFPIGNKKPPVKEACLFPRAMSATSQLHSLSSSSQGQYTVDCLIGS